MSGTPGSLSNIKAIFCVSINSGNAIATRRDLTRSNTTRRASRTSDAKKLHRHLLLENRACPADLGTDFGSTPDRDLAYSRRATRDAFKSRQRPSSRQGINGASTGSRIGSCSLVSVVSERYKRRGLSPNNISDFTPNSHLLAPASSLYDRDAFPSIKCLDSTSR